MFIKEIKDIKISFNIKEIKGIQISFKTDNIFHVFQH